MKNLGELEYTDVLQIDIPEGLGSAPVQSKPY